ncbi:MAG: PAS domain-containing sensor histidine kinase [Alphaproteobacteria bacterium]|nr:PAS domain-containing sensor histidine kinase [Alphaproteobacteria bacterium]
MIRAFRGHYRKIRCGVSSAGDYIRDYFKGEKIFSLLELKITRAWQNRLALALIAGSLLCGFATYVALTESAPFGAYPNSVFWLLNLDLVFLLALSILVARRLVGVWSGRKRGLAGSHLHVRLVYTFSILVAAPTVVMTIFSVFLFHFGIQTWFSERVSTAIEKSQAVAQAYLEEHRQVIRADVLAMANDIDRQATFLADNEEAFEAVIKTQSFLRNFSEAIVFEAGGRVLARSGLTFSLEFESVSDQILEETDKSEVVVMTGANDDRVRALTPLNSLHDTYLYVGRLVDPQVLSYVSDTRRAAEDYATLQSRYSGFQVIMAMIFVVVGLLMMLAAIWLGLLLARELVSPIGVLIRTADRVRAGDLSARVPEQSKVQDFVYLAQSFNRMTRQIEEQQKELIEANRQLDSRRRFTETVLEGVSSGVLGLNAAGIVTLANSSALKLLNSEELEVTGMKAGDILPELEMLLLQAREKPGSVLQAEIAVHVRAGHKRVFLIRMAMEGAGVEEAGAIVTFDDITDFQAAQKKAAWSDVARRIAHEIKNPLTPIQLSAERLKRKYLDQITGDRETFSQCTDTIIKNVEDIGRMVNEFSSFARMPEPVMDRECIRSRVEDTLVLYKQARPDIGFVFEAEEGRDFMTVFDSRQVRQALNNLLQNAVDSIETRLRKEREAGTSPAKGEIKLVLGYHGDYIFVAVTDNGNGFPEGENLLNLMEPYVTHKAKGTGLGLAIVKKIMEDHGGDLHLGVPAWFKNRWKTLDGKGATLILLFPLKNDRKETARA